MSSLDRAAPKSPDLPRGAFTLVELLVVITIIVILLALLTPALDRAMYSAQLAVCAAHQDAMVTGAQAYAMDHKRYYPHKPGAHNGSDVWWRMDVLYIPPGVGRTGRRPPQDLDHRQTVKDYIQHKLFVDPVAGKVSVAKEDNDVDTEVLASYFLLDGFQFRAGPDQGPLGEGMIKMGNRLKWSSRNDAHYAFNTLVADKLHYNRNDGYTTAGHPDTTVEKAVLAERQNGPGLVVGPVASAKMTYTHYNFFNINGPEGAHGLLDLNYGMQDGSVRRVSGIKPANFNSPLNVGDHPLRGVPFITEGGAPADFSPSNWLLEGS
jgi:prepilin-type N-terminal cleavage/methylation domain-containing protein